MFNQFILVGIGGAIGSMLRYMVSFLTMKYYNGTFPLATFSVNIAGCLFIGIFAGLVMSYFPMNMNLKFLMITGFCGGFTTFSTFAMENINLYHAGNLTTAVIYTLSSVLLGIFAVMLGIYITTAKMTMP